MTGRRDVVLVSGSPGAGKSTLARPLATALGLPLLSKDVIKEALHDSLGDLDDDPVVSSSRLGAAAMSLLWRLAADCPGAVLEANFRREHLDIPKLTALAPCPIEVYCRVPPSLASARFAARAARPGHHPVHAASRMSVEAMADYRRPLGLGPVIEVDTSRPVDIDVVTARVRAELATVGSGPGTTGTDSVTTP